MKFSKQLVPNGAVVQIMCPSGYSNPNEFRTCRDSQLFPTDLESPFTCSPGKCLYNNISKNNKYKILYITLCLSMMVTMYKVIYILYINSSVEFRVVFENY